MISNKYIAYYTQMQQARQCVPPVSEFSIGRHLYALGYALEDMFSDELANGGAANA